MPCTWRRLADSHRPCQVAPHRSDLYLATLTREGPRTEAAGIRAQVPEVALRQPSTLPLRGARIRVPVPLSAPPLPWPAAVTAGLAAVRHAGPAPRAWPAVRYELSKYVTLLLKILSRLLGKAPSCRTWGCSGGSSSSPVVCLLSLRPTLSPPALTHALCLNTLPPIFHCQPPQFS